MKEECLKRVLKDLQTTLNCQKENNGILSEAVRVTIIEKEGWSYSKPTRYEVIVKASPEFMREPEQILSEEEKVEYISQRIKEEFYKLLTKNL